ncbi:MAG: Radical domain protein [Geobacteraceae bacterium]|jgi:biotin synthase|nr:Radical domain protein [Geobacteraceae bacterium]
MERNEIIRWLKTEDGASLDHLWQRADEVRLRNVGEEVYLRGLIEVSNICARNCGYCGIRADNHKIGRYRMTEDEIMSCVNLAVEFGYGTVVLQCGEDYGIKKDWMSEIIRHIKKETDLAITLSLGERSDEELAAWREAGADRYLLRFETSNRVLYDSIHPPLPGVPSDRIAMIGRIREIGFEVGSGIMVGIPGQTYADLAEDIELFRSLDLDMIGVGPYIPHAETPMGRSPGNLRAPEGEQVPNTELMAYKVVALTRLVCPQANIPSTTAIATLNRDKGRELGLSRGANIVMPNLTPLKYRAMYEIYPAKAAADETPEESRANIHRRILSIGRKIGEGRGDSRNFAKSKRGS